MFWAKIPEVSLKKIRFCCHEQGWKLSRVPSGVTISNVETESTNVSTSVFCRNINLPAFYPGDWAEKILSGLKIKQIMLKRTKFA